VKPISESIPHIYLSALPFSPKMSIVAAHYQLSFPQTLSIELGRGSDWPPELLRFEGHSDWVTSVAYSPDGKHIVSGSGDGTVHVWDAQSGHLAAGPFEGHSDWVTSVAYSPDGKHIVSGSGDRTVRVWDPESVISYAMQARCFANFTSQSQIRDGWILGPDSELSFWVPDMYRAGLWWPDNSAVISKHIVRLNFCRFVHGTKWCT
jgi:WD40 repeat protein